MARRQATKTAGTSKPDRKEAVVRLLEGESAAAVAREYGVSSAELSKWRDDFVKLGLDSGNVNGKTSEILAEKIELVDEMVEELSHLAHVILEASTNLSVNATQTAAAVTQTTTIVEEVRQTVEISSNKAKTVSTDARNVLHTSELGQKAANDVRVGMQAIKEHMESLTQTVLTLRNQTKQVGEIIATVDDIAQQSNLLAVNAAIEAARAGEQGKGFAVVAQAIKSLADQSKKATSNVRSILNEIVEATASATMKTEHGSKVVKDGEGFATQASSAMVALAESIDRSSQAAIQIEASSQQQLQGVHQVLEAMKSVEEASNDNQKGAEELEQAVVRLNELGQELKNLTEELGVGKDSNRK